MLYLRQLINLVLKIQLSDCEEHFDSAFELFFKNWDVKGSDNLEIKDLLKYLRDSDWVYGSLKGWYEA